MAWPDSHDALSKALIAPSQSESINELRPNMSYASALSESESKTRSAMSTPHLT